MKADEHYWRVVVACALIVARPSVLRGPVLRERLNSLGLPPS
jgi:hypothetical protein